MDSPKPVFWHQGLFLQPQHFQLTDQYHRSLLNPYQRFMHPHFWGVGRFEMSPTSIERRTCEIEHAEVLFQDGTDVRFPENAVLTSRSFEDAWVEPEKPFTIYLGLRRLSQYDDNVTVVTDATRIDEVRTRYVTLAEPEETRDAYVDEGPIAQVKTLRHVLRIVWETERDDLEDYMLIPVAQVVRDEGGIRFDHQFYPPLLNINASDELNKLLREIRDDVTGRSLQLIGFDTKGRGKTEFDATLMRYKLASRTLSRYIPRLFHFLEDPGVHPWDVYGLLREMVGEVSTFTDNVNVLGETQSGERLLPVYDHQQLGACFAAARSVLVSMLNEITIGPDYLVEMPFDDSCFTADVPPEFFQQTVDFYLIVSIESDFEQHQQSLLTTGKVAARDRIDILVERSLPGIGLIHVPQPPAQMPRRPDAHYVRLDSADEQWAAIERQRNIALLWAEAPEDTKIELVIVRR